MKEKPAKSFSARNFANVYFTESNVTELLNYLKKIKYNVHEQLDPFFDVGLAIDIIPKTGGNCSFFAKSPEIQGLYSKNR